ncbi:hypothetical protein GCM10017714_25440 [Curtobacterium pusillum]|nr:hypothetical protein GCM10017610_29590 [Curtobacterium pusillum]
MAVGLAVGEEPWCESAERAETVEDSELADHSVVGAWERADHGVVGVVGVVDVAGDQERAGVLSAGELAVEDQRPSEEVRSRGDEGR